MILVKIGGGAALNLPGIVDDLARLDERFLVVHGANALRDELARTLGRPRRTLTSLSGYESVYSDADAIDLLMMAYAGLRNKRIVELCQQRGLDAIGLTGLDGRAVRGERNPGIRTYEDGRKKVVRDLSGKPRHVNVRLLTSLLDQGLVPVLTVPIADEHGTAVNTENDEVVRLLQEAFQAEKVVQLIEAPGLLDDPSDPASRIPRLTAAECEAREARAGGRFRRKLLALRKLVQQGRTTVYLGDGRTDRPVSDALAGKGTIVTC